MFCELNKFISFLPLTLDFFVTRSHNRNTCRLVNLHKFIVFYKVFVYLQ